MAVFVKVSDLGSFAAAAEAMGMSPQMVAKHVVFLEDRLGTALLHRTTRRQSLTDVGRVFYDRCKQLLADVEAAESVALERRIEDVALSHLDHRSLAVGRRPAQRLGDLFWTSL
jgi:DNA-binding transcriptional LysR family regulator